MGEKTKILTGANLLLEALEREGVELVFGYPGGAVLPLYDALYDAEITHILPRHEQGAIHAAEGYARVSGKPGVVIVTSGPGATNVLTGLADAMIDSLPLVVFTGQVATPLIGSDAFQEADMIGLTTPITKHNYQIRNISDIPRVVKEAFHIATTGRPGPVVIDLPKDMAAGAAEKVETPKEVHLPGYQPTYEPNILQVQRLLDAVMEAEKPVILAGAGILHGEAHRELTLFAEMYQIPVVHTLLGLGAFPADNPLFLGMGGMHGTYTANTALYEADLLINIGARFDDRLTGNLAHFAKQAIVAHIDIDPVEIGKNVPTQIPIVGCAKCTLQALLKKEGQKENHWEWLALQQKRKAQYPLRYEKSEKVIKPQTVIELIHQLTDGEAIITTDVGQHQMWAAQYYPLQQPHRWVTSGGLGTMGFGFPAAIGAQLAEKDAVVVSIVGDGGFQMTLQELSLLKEYQLPIKVVIVNNSSLGMVRQWQESFYEARYSHSVFQEHPDFVMLAAAYGIRGVRITEPALLHQQLKDAIEYDGPVLIDCCVVQSELVNPMIPPGKGIHEMEGV